MMHETLLTIQIAACETDESEEWEWFCDMSKQLDLPFVPRVGHRIDGARVEWVDYCTRSCMFFVVLKQVSSFGRQAVYDAQVQRDRWAAMGYSRKEEGGQANAHLDSISESD